MNMLDIRLWLATEAGLFVSIIGVFLAMAALLVVIKPGTRIVRVGVCLLSGAIVVLLVANLFDMKRNYVDIPTVCVCQKESVAKGRENGEQSQRRR